MSRTEKKDGKPQRPERVPMGQGQKLKFPQYEDPNYKLRLISSKPGRLAEAEGAWWEYVKDGDGNKVTVPSGQYPLHLMRIPIEYWTEDQKAKQARNIETLNNESKLSQGEYSPNENGHAIQRDGEFDPLA